jgi:uncharacterized protein DUF5657
MATATFGDIIIDQTGIDPWGALKIVYLFAIVLYIIFALIVVRQITLMTGTLDGQISGSVKLLGKIHLLFSIFIFILALIVL